MNTNISPVPWVLLQRACACGQHTSHSGSECEECKKKRQGMLQRASVNSSPVNEVPPIVHEVLRSPGQPLDPATRAYMEPRFGHNFSGVRVHTDMKAAESARVVNAMAYTVGRHVVFGDHQFHPETQSGKILLIHELVHTLQQRNSSSFPRDLQAVEAGSPYEQEAQQATEQLKSQPLPLATRQRQPAIQRWAITGNIATSNAPSDTLGRLAQMAGASFNDWKCIQPTSMRTFSSGRGTSTQKARYERFIQIGDQFDISNLTTTAGQTLRIHLFNPVSEWKDSLLAGSLYPGSLPSPNQDVDLDISNAAGDGKTPIQEFIIFGHTGGPEMWGGAVPSPFGPAAFNPEDPTPSFSQAEIGLLPRRCWFTRNASARSVGCDSNAFGTDFARAYLRKGASVITTTASVRPRCQGLPFQVGSTLGVPGGCAWYNGVDFAASPAIGAATVEGPFWTVADFHAGSHWATIAGNL